MPSPLRRCFVIGPMRDMDRLRRLAFDVVAPLLAPFGYTVTTPDHADMGLVMNQVLLSLEQADLLIADLTGNNPNVLYELGIYHAFGKPYVAVKEEHPGTEPEKTPFDIAAYRYLAIDLRDVAATQALLSDFLTRSQLVQKADTLDFFSNPVTDFYLSPIAEIPTAIGLAKNYVRNFLTPLLPGIFDTLPGSDTYGLNVLVEVPSTAVPGRATGPLQPLSTSERDTLLVDILIPNRLAWAEKTHLRALQNQPRRPFLNAQVIADRPYSTHAIRQPDGTVVINDVPTVLSTLNQSIEQRRRSIHDVRLKAEGWEVLETQEIERFEAKCRTFVQTSVPPIYQDRVRVVRWDGQ